MKWGLDNELSGVDSRGEEGKRGGVGDMSLDGRREGGTVDKGGCMSRRITGQGVKGEGKKAGRRRGGEEGQLLDTVINTSTHG